MTGAIEFLRAWRDQSNSPDYPAEATRFVATDEEIMELVRLIMRKKREAERKNK